MIRYPELKSDPTHVYELIETRDKGQNTAAVANSLGIQAAKIILMGDSGGDGPHFQWGAESGAFLIGSMTKASLDSYCREKGIVINLRFGLDYSQNDRKGLQEELRIDFRGLRSKIEKIICR
jgi:hypothetical protein